MNSPVPETIRLLLPHGAVEKMSLEEYVRGVVAAAMPDDAPLEALKAQAVAARTFGARTQRHREHGADVCTLRHCQVWQSAPSALATRAVQETRGMIVHYHGEMIEAYYFEHCDGITRDATGILLQPPPYLQSVNCPCGFATLKGHGIGMCQRGALVMARLGETFDTILRHYYTDITLEQDGVELAATPQRRKTTLPKSKQTPKPVETMPTEAVQPTEIISPPPPIENKTIVLESTRLTIEPVEPETTGPTLEPMQEIVSAIEEEISAPESSVSRDERLPEELPTVISTPTPIETVMATPPPILEENIAQPATSQIVIDHLPGPRVIAGDLGKPNILVTIRDVEGHAVLTLSGTATHHGVGGFEVPLAVVGTYTVSFAGQTVEIQMQDETVIICYSA